ncbi:MAG: hypothetical protein RSF67_04870 [Clostridia bacterium]
MYYCDTFYNKNKLKSYKSDVELSEEIIINRFIKGLRFTTDDNYIVKNINIKICDDFYGDTHIHKNKIQKTFMYIDDINIADDISKEILDLVNENIKDYLNVDGDIVYCSKTKKCKINLYNITHKFIDDIMLPTLNSLNMIITDNYINYYRVNFGSVS